MINRILLVGLFASASIAATPIDGLYAVAAGGFAQLPNNINNTTATQSKYSSGFNAGGALGYKQAFWRYEAEVEYVKANLNQININNVTNTATGYSQGLFGLLSAYIDLPYKQATLLQPYIGAGLGYGWIQTNFKVTPNIDSLYNNNTFAYHGSAGLNFNFSENYGLYVGYRYIGTTHIDTLGSTFQAHMLTGGAIYRFDSCEFK